MVWGAIWSSGFRILVRIRNSLEGPVYQALLDENLLLIWDEDFLQLQDNALPHSFNNAIFGRKWHNGS